MPLENLTQSELIDIWQEQADSIVQLCQSLDAAQWAAPTPCAGWNAGDIPAHVIDIESLLAQLPRPDHQVDTSTLPHVKNDVGSFTELGVDYRRGMPAADVLSELRDVIVVRRAQLDGLPEDEPVVGPFGNPTTVDRLLRIRIFDMWAHEQDIRTAIGSDGGWSTRPAQVSLEQILRGLPYVWARTVGAPEGSTVRVEVTDPLEVDVTVAAMADGKGAVVATVDDPTVRLQCTWPDFMRLGCGRVDVDDPALRSRISLTGDPALAQALLPALAITP